eukprot:2793416-Rhodomonas_salina.1
MSFPLAAYALPMACPALTWRLAYALAVSLRACYAMSGTDLLNGAIGLRASYAMSGTNTAHGAIGLRARYVQCPVQSSVLSQRLVQSPYALSGTKFGANTVYGATEGGVRKHSARAPGTSPLCSYTYYCMLLCISDSVTSTTVGVMVVCAYAYPIAKSGPGVAKYLHNGSPGTGTKDPLCPYARSTQKPGTELGTRLYQSELSYTRRSRLVLRPTRP